MASLNDLVLRLLINAQDNTGPATRSTRQGIESISTQLERMQRLAVAVFASDLVVEWGAKIVELADNYKVVDGQLQRVAKSQAEYNRSLKEIPQIARDARGELAPTVEVYAKIRTAVGELHGTADQAVVVTRSLLQSIAILSQGAEQDSYGLLAFSQALDEGVVRGENFNSILSSTPGLAQAIADGMGVARDALRGMAEAGELSITKVLNALIAQSDEVERKMQNVPLSVSKAVKIAMNDVLMYVGELDKGIGATGVLADTIVFAGGHLEEIGQIIKVLAEIRIAGWVVGLIKARAAMAQTAFAANELAAAQAHQAMVARMALEAEVQMAGIRVTAARAVVSDAQMQVRVTRAVTVAEEARTRATNALTAALGRLHQAEQQQIAAQARLNQLNNDAPPALGRMALALEIVGKAINALFVIFIAWEIGKAIGEWLSHFAWFNQGMIRVAEVVEMVITIFKALANQQSLSELSKQLRDAHARYNELSDAASDSAKRQAEAEKFKTERVEYLLDKQETAFKHLEEGQKGLADAQKTRHQQALADLEAALASQSAAILANTALSEQKKQQWVAAETLKSHAAQIALTENFNQQQIAQIEKFAAQERAYKQQQLAAKRGDEVQAKTRLTLEIQALDVAELAQKRKVYGETYRALQQHIGSLVGLRQQELAAAKSIDDEMVSSRERADQAILAIKRLSMDEGQLLRSHEQEAEQALADFKTELAKGDKANRDELVKAADKAIGLIGKTTEEKYKESGSDWERSKAVAAIEGVQKALNTALAAGKTAHDDNAKAIGNELAAAKNGLDAVSSALAAIDQKLVDAKKLAIEVDQASLKAAQAQIDSLTATATKIINIVTQNSGDAPAPAQATGGPAGSPTGEPWRFATGGFLPQAGQLPGYGGGDKIRALLEAGEFVVRKEAVAKWGLGFMRAINQGQLPVPRFAVGGLAGGDMTEELQALKDERDQAAINHILNSSTFYGMGWIGGEVSARTAVRRAEGQLRDMGRLDLLPKVADILERSLATRPRDPKEWQNQVDMITVLRKHLFDKQQDVTAALPDNLQAIDFANVSIPSILQPSINNLLQTADTPAFASPASPNGLLASTGRPANVGGGKTVTLRFESPDGQQAVSGQFGENDARAMLDILKSAGMRTTGGVF